MDEPWQIVSLGAALLVNVTLGVGRTAIVMELGELGHPSKVTTTFTTSPLLKPVLVYELL